MPKRGCALMKGAQTIYFDKIMFWKADSAGYPDWGGKSAAGMNAEQRLSNLISQLSCAGGMVGPDNRPRNESGSRRCLF